jgi:16S rRNA (guanine527-N7)-methyltransferase
VNPELIQKGLEKALSISLSGEQAALLIAHFAFVIEQNRNVNLTGITDEETGVILHIEDSLRVLPELERAPEGPLVDLGSGGGFPGIPLAILSGRDCVLVEATKKKAQAIQQFLGNGPLSKRVTVEAQRIEAFSQQKRNHFAVATARALSSLPTLAELAAPLLRKEGVLLAYKGKPTNDELQRMICLEDELGMKVVSTRKFFLSDNQTERTIVTIQKTGKSRRPLPRRDGQAQHHPLA